MATATASREAASVVAWFEFYTRLYEDHARVARPSHTLLQLLQSAFPSLYEDVVARRLALGSDEWACVIILLEAFYEVELGIDRSALNDAMTFEDASLQSACVETLEYVVSALVQSDSKKQFVGDIMSMEGSVQVDIMAVIERVLQHTASMAANGASCRDESETPGFENDPSESRARDDRLGTPSRSVSGQTSASSSPAVTTSRSPLHLARNAELERLQRANDILKEESIHIAKELEDIKSKLQHTEAENTSLHESIKSVQLQAEMDILKKERTVRSYFDERMHSLQRELDRVTRELEEKAAVAKEVDDLRDEVDLLRPSAEKLARAEATLAKYKTKIEDLASVNEKLRRTEEANADLVEKNLSLENQAAKTTALQRKLADSKEANTAIQFYVSELESKLSRLTTELEAKRLECDSTTAALLEAKSLNSQLQQTVDQQIDAKEGYATSDMGSVGGISELNPELMEKLARLEHENATLRSQVDGTTSDRIDSLLDDLEDVKRMKKSFETKYFETNDSLKETLAKLKSVEGLLSAVQEELAERITDLSCRTAERDDLTERLQNAERMISELTDSNAANTAEIQRRVEVEQSLNTELVRRGEKISTLEQTLHQRVQDLLLANERNVRLSEDVSAHLLERHDMVLRRNELEDKITCLEAQSLSHVARIAEVERDREMLQGQLERASHQILSLQESETRFGIRCEELDGILAIKTEHIDEQLRAMSQLATTQEEMEKNTHELEECRRSQEIRIQQQTERLQALTDDLAMVRTENTDLSRDVEHLEEQVRALTTQHEDQLQKVADDQARLNAAHELELERLLQENADTITRMTSVIDEKSNSVQHIKKEMKSMCESHERVLEELRVRLEQKLSVIQKEKDDISSEMAKYAASHSYTNEEVTTKETELRSKLSELSATQDASRDMKSRFETQEAKLREAVKSQLETNRKLVEVNHAVKNELAKKEAQVIQLENAVTRLDSRIRMFERERNHFSSEDGSSRETEDSSTSYSSQLNSHLTQITEELDLLRKENRKLQERLSRRVLDQAHDGEDGALQSTKSYLMDKIRQLELAKAAEEDKKRELLLVNAKLIQDRKQIQVRNASDSKEVLLLKEKVNTWMLRDERRKKEHEAFAQRVRELEYENKRLRLNMPAGSVEFLPELTSHSSQESEEPIAPLHSVGSDEQENIPPSEMPTSPSVISRKRKLDSDADHDKLAQCEDPHQDKEPLNDKLQEPQHTVDAPIEDPAPVPAATSSPAPVPRAKRRMSLFMSSRLTSAVAAAATTTRQEDEKPSECQQQ